MSVDIEQVRILSEGSHCAGTLFLPKHSSAPYPAVLMSHGFGAVRTMRNLPDVATALAEAGIAALTVDFRFLGESEGTPRQLVSPLRQRQDLHNALTWLELRSDIDRHRLGLWGTSFSGGQALQVAAFDRRVKAVVAQVPATDLYRQLLSAPESYQSMLDELIIQDRLRRVRGEAGGTIKLAAPAGEVSLFGEESLDWIQRNAQENPTLENSVTIASLEEFVETDPANYIEAISPTPLLMIMAEQDQTVSPDLTRKAFDRAGEPKQLVTVAGSHYSVYDDPAIMSQVAASARDWFVKHLSHASSS